MKTRNQTKTTMALAAVAMAGILSAGADSITIPNAGFENGGLDPRFFDTGGNPIDGKDVYPRPAVDIWAHFDTSDNGGPLRLWDPGVAGTTSPGFGGNAPEGRFVMRVYTRYNDDKPTVGPNYPDGPHVRDFEACAQLLTATFDPTKTYTLTAKVGHPDGRLWNGYALQIAVGGTNVSGASYAGSVKGGTVIAEYASRDLVPEGTFVTASVTYAPNQAHESLAGQRLQIRLCALEDPTNHATISYVAFDDVRLDASVGPPEIKLSISPAVGGGNRLAWNSRAGMLYNVKSSTNVGAALPTWTLFQRDIVATPPTNTLPVAPSAEPQRFFVVEERPRPTVFSDNFESGIGAWSLGSEGAPGTAWELGIPQNVGPTAAHSPTRCFGSNIGGNYGIDANIWLRSPVIDLRAVGSAALDFWHFTSIWTGGNDFGTVSVLDASDESVLAVLAASVDGDTAGWVQFTRVLPAAALGKQIKLEFRFQSVLGGKAGWYIDDVKVFAP